MPSQIPQRRKASCQSSSTHDSRSRRSNDSYGSQSTAPTSYYSSIPSDYKRSLRSTDSEASSVSSYKARQVYDYHNDVSPTTSLYSSSLDSLASTTLSCEDLDSMDIDESSAIEDNPIPPLPVYQPGVVEPNVRVSTPHDFSKYFPSLNRLNVRHDEFTADGNMNLRIETVVTGRRRTAIQLFHLRMYDLVNREFSLRRYSRDSGREVCNSKRKYREPKPQLAPSPNEKPTLKQSMSAALKTLSGAGVRSTMLRRGSASSTTTGRPGTSYSTAADNETVHSKNNLSLSRLSLDSRHGKAKSQKPRPTNTIKLEFSNYARVDVTRRRVRGNIRYVFEWWGHRYYWKRTVDKELGLVSFHLVRDGHSSVPIAHIVPETRSPSQVLADEHAGGWIPPCAMWIADESVVTAITDVADVIMATGLIALVDDCIITRWQSDKKPKNSRRLSVSSLIPKKPISLEAVIQHVFGGASMLSPRRCAAAANNTPQLTHHHRVPVASSAAPSSHLRFTHAVAAC